MYWNVPLSIRSTEDDKALFRLNKEDVTRSNVYQNIEEMKDLKKADWR